MQYYLKLKHNQIIGNNKKSNISYFFIYLTKRIQENKVRKGKTTPYCSKIHKWFVERLFTGEKRKQQLQPASDLHQKVFVRILGFPRIDRFNGDGCLQTRREAFSPSRNSSSCRRRPIFSQCRVQSPSFYYLRSFLFSPIFRLNAPDIFFCSVALF